MTIRLKSARLRHSSSLGGIDYRSPRGLDKAMILQLGGWLRDSIILIIRGPVAVGKTWLACKLAQKAGCDG